MKASACVLAGLMAISVASSTMVPLSTLASLGPRGAPAAPLFFPGSRSVTLMARGKASKPKPQLGCMGFVRKGVAAVDASLPKVADALIGGVGLALSMGLLAVLEAKFKVKLFAAPMMASGIIFFAPQTPPDPGPFVSGTIGSASVCAAIFALCGSRKIPVPMASGAAAGSLLMWYKATNTIFPPAAVLSVLMAGSVASEAATSVARGWASSLNFVAFPWLAGHAVLYASATVIGQARVRVRTVLTQRQMTQMGRKLAGFGTSLRETFDKYDTSKDGHLDPLELKLALQVATGVEMSLPAVRAIVGAVDADGDGLISFKEFEAICKQER
mmetsp:Transcript_7336/g.17701  ORF Transcript_7336/g.17701 Transcript_7336/m.17701 type:complete len:329 (-) Transcript_7336:146-1132(-)